MNLRQSRLLALAVLLVVLVSGCGGANSNALSAPDLGGDDVVSDLLDRDDQMGGDADLNAAIEEAVTPYQQRLAQTLQERATAGLPTPSSVSFQYELLPPQEQATEDGDGREHVVQIIAKTVLHFDGPEEAGYDVWPALVVTGTVPAGANGTLLAGDYSELYRTLLAAQIPSIWDEIEFGQEPRTHTVAETFEVAIAQEEMPSGATFDNIDPMSIESILIGLTYTGPQINYTIADQMSVRDFLIYEYEAGIKLDWTFGLRLPVEVGLTGPVATANDSVTAYASTLSPLDWMEQDYMGAGVAPEGGNEFVLRLDAFVGLRAILLEIDVCPICYVERSVDESASFATPFGPDATLPLPEIAMPIWDWQLGGAAVSTGIIVSPRIGSSKITADWHARLGDECAESGQLIYTTPEAPASFGPGDPCFATADDDVKIQLDGFRYWLDQFHLGLNVTLDSEIFGYDVWSGSPPPVEVNLSPLTQFLWLGTHTECNWRFQCAPTESHDSVTLTTQEN